MFSNRQGIGLYSSCGYFVCADCKAFLGGSLPERVPAARTLCSDTLGVVVRFLQSGFSGIGRYLQLMDEWTGKTLHELGTG